MQNASLTPHVAMLAKLKVFIIHDTDTFESTPTTRTYVRAHTQQQQQQQQHTHTHISHTHTHITHTSHKPWTNGPNNRKPGVFFFAIADNHLLAVSIRETFSYPSCHFLTFSLLSGEPVRYLVFSPSFFSFFFFFFFSRRGKCLGPLRKKTTGPLTRVYRN